MIICYYSDNGKIYQCHTVEDKTYEECLSIEKEYNLTNRNKKVKVLNVEDNSVLAFLMKKYKEKQKYDSEVIYDIKRTISELEDMIDDLFS